MSTPGAGPDGAPSLTIGAVAKLTGKSASAIRYYEQIGLLPEPARAAGRRRYGRGHRAHAGGDRDRTAGGPGAR